MQVRFKHKYFMGYAEDVACLPVNVNTNLKLICVATFSQDWCNINSKSKEILETRIDRDKVGT